MEVLTTLGLHNIMSKNIWVFPTEGTNKNYFQYASVSLTKLIKENALSLATNLSTVSL